MGGKGPYFSSILYPRSPFEAYVENYTLVTWGVRAPLDLAHKVGRSEMAVNSLYQLISASDERFSDSLQMVYFPLSVMIYLQLRKEITILFAFCRCLLGEMMRHVAVYIVSQISQLFNVACSMYI
jgi:hypothetical protein